MKTFNLRINEEDESGVDYIALVDSPAIESDWIAFNEAKQNFKIEDEEKRIVSGYFMIADKPIYRNNEKFGEHNVIFDCDTIKQIALKFMRSGFNSQTNLMHNEDYQLDDVFVFESLLVDSARGVAAPSNFEKVADGSWWGSMFVKNDEVWESIKQGKFKGFSVEGMFGYADEFKTQQKEAKELIEWLDSIGK